MPNYLEMTAAQLRQEAATLQTEYNDLKAKGLKLDLSRGKPDSVQLQLSYGILDALDSASDLQGYDNYGILEGIPEARALMADLLGLRAEEIFVGGNSSLNLMHDCLGVAFLHGMPSSPVPWHKLPQVKFLCPSPGYDRHFAVTDHYGFELIPVPMTSQGPDMDLVEQLVAADSSVKGIWCIPQYSNPTGITYSDETVRRLAALSPAAPDFLIMWDNAYLVHDLYPDEPDQLLNLMDELKKAGHQNMGLLFTSTSKITFPGAGIGALGCSGENLAHFLRHFGLQTIGYDKLNQLRHTRYFADADAVRQHMRGHAKLLLPKFEAVQKTLENELGHLGIADWTTPRGGYFVSLNTPDGCAKRTVALCKQAGVTMTPAGATFPNGHDPRDRNIRIAPTFASTEDVWLAAALLCLCVKIASVEKLLGQAHSCAS